METAKSTHTILIAEDSPTMRQLMVFALRRLPGVSILEASNGVEALKKMSHCQVNLLFTDINMPIMDGLKLLSLLKGDPKLRAIPVVIITTEGAQEDRDRGLALGAAEYLTKPIQTPQILEIASSLLHLS